MNLFQKMRKQFRRIFEPIEDRDQDAGARLEGPPTFPDGFDPQAAALVEQPPHPAPLRSRGDVDDSGLSANIRHIDPMSSATSVPVSSQIIAAIEEPLSILARPFSPDYPDTFGSDNDRAPRQPSGLRRTRYAGPPQPDAQAAAPLAKRTPSGRDSHASNAGTTEYDPFSLVGLESALSPFHGPKATVASSPRPEGAVPSVPDALVSASSSLSGPFSPDYPVDFTAGSRIPSSGATQREPSELRRPAFTRRWRPAVQAAPAVVQPTPVVRNTDGSNSRTRAANPFSMADLQSALPPFEVRPEAAASSSRVESAVRSLSGEPQPGTYGNRSNEQRRLGIARVFGNFECEHVAGFSVVNPFVERASDQGKALADAMPAYYEAFSLHQEHPGSRKNDRRLDANIHGGWKTSGEYRQDQRKTLRDPQARKEGTSVSNAYQLNALGYAHILRAEEKGVSKPSFIPEYMKQNRYLPAPELPPSYCTSEQAATAANSFRHMVRHDPPIVHRLNGIEETQRLGQRGQVEALVARAAATSGVWPSGHTIGNVAREILPPPAYEEKRKVWAAAGAYLPDPPPRYEERTRDRVRSIV